MSRPNFVVQAALDPEMSPEMNVVIVESPAKAKTINKYLGSGYELLASFGHVRDPPEKNARSIPKPNFT